MSTKTKKSGAGRSAIADVVAREYTIHLHKRVSCKKWQKMGKESVD